MNLHAQRKNRQRNHRLVAAARHHVPRERHLGDVEFFVDRPHAGFAGFGSARLQFDASCGDFAVEQRTRAMVVGEHKVSSRSCAMVIPPK